MGKFKRHTAQDTRCGRTELCAEDGGDLLGVHEEGAVRELQLRDPSGAGSRGAVTWGC